MPEIKLPGLSTGIDTNAIVQQLMEVNRRRLYLYEDQKKEVEEKQTAVDELNTTLKSYQDTTEALADVSQLKSFDTSSSDDDVLSASANSNAVEGTHNIQVKQLAGADKYVHSGFRRETSYVGQGNFIMSYNNEEFVIQTTDETTLTGLVGLINNATDNPGVSASVLKFDDGTTDGIYHLVLAGQDSGSDYAIKINSSNTEVLASDTNLESGSQNADATDKLVDLDTFTGSMAGGEQIHIAGTQHDGTIVDYTFDVNQYTTVEDMVDEINTAFSDTASAVYQDGQIKLTDHTNGASLMTISTFEFLDNGSGAALTLPTFSQDTVGGSITAANANLDAAEFTQTQTAKDSLIKVDDYPPGDGTDDANWISRSSNSIDDVISGVSIKLHSVTWDDADAATHDDYVEVAVNRDTEALKEKVKNMVTAYNDIIDFFEENASYDANTKTAGVLFGEYSLTAIKTMIRSPFSGSASGFSGTDPFTTAQDIGLEIDNNDRLKFTESDFDDAISENYMAALRLLGAKKTGYTSGDDSNLVKFYDSSEKATTAGTYEVRVYGDGTDITSAQIRALGETEWRDMDFSAGENTIVGDMTTDDNGNYLYSEAALLLTVDVSETDPVTPLETTVYVRQGIAGEAEEMMGDLLHYKNGRVTITEDAYADKVQTYNDMIEKEQDRLADEEERLSLKYARLERNLQMIQQQFAGL